MFVYVQVLDKEYGASCDMWSLGVITYTLLCGWVSSLSILRQAFQLVLRDRPLASSPIDVSFDHMCGGIGQPCLASITQYPNPVHITMALISLSQVSALLGRHREGDLPEGEERCVVHSQLLFIDM